MASLTDGQTTFIFVALMVFIPLWVMGLMDDWEDEQKRRRKK